MNKSEIESKLKELKGKQSAHFSQKKANRNANDLTATRDEIKKMKEALSALINK